jgi:hypothetical protein
VKLDVLHEMKSMKILLFLVLLVPFSMSAQNKDICDKHYIYFNDALKFNDFQRAYVYWQFLVDGNCDELILKKRNVISNGGAVISHLIKNAKGERRQNLIDSLIINYEKGSEIHKSDLKIKELLGMSIAKYRKNYEKVRKHLKISISGLKEKSKNSAVQYYFNALQNLKLQHQINREDAVGEFLWLKDMFHSKNIQLILDRGGLAWLDCDDIIEYYSEFIDGDSVTMELVEEVLRLMNEKDCFSSEKHSEFYVKVLTIKLERTPTAQGFFFKSKYELSQNKRQAAQITLRKAYLLAMDSGDLKHDIVEFGANYLGDDWFEKWMDDFPGDGEPWLYNAREMAKRVNDLSISPDLIIRKLVYVKAIEYCIKAKTLDPNLKQTADELIRYYKRLLPECDQLFQRSLHRGNHFNLNTVGDIMIDCN